MTDPTLLLKFAERVRRDVSPIVFDQARLNTLDWIGCAMAGAQEPVGAILKNAKPEGASGEAFYWGGLGNVLEMDDVHKLALLHPGPCIVPAALLMAEKVGATGAETLKAIVRGYEATIRLGAAVGPAHYALWHNTGTCGGIGAAAACASLLRLGIEETAHAMALAVSQATGFWQTRHEPASMGKQLHTAHATRAGFEAAIMASKGFRGPLTILEGPQGFFAATCGEADPNAVVTDDPEWLIQTISFKPWPACRHAHPVIDAALILRQRVGEGVEEPLRVRTYADALKFCDNPHPKSVIEAKFSLQHAVAVCIKRGAPKLDDFSLEAITDPELTDLRSRVSLSVGEAYEIAYPAHFGAEIEVGREVITVTDAWGDPENPISSEALKDKARMLIASTGRDPESIDAIIEAVDALDRVENVSALVAEIREGLS